jgi:hypothetical protein
MFHRDAMVYPNVSAPSGKELYHLQFSLQAASPETFGYNFVQTFHLYFSKCRLTMSVLFLCHSSLSFYYELFLINMIKFDV